MLVKASLTKFTLFLIIFCALCITNSSPESQHEDGFCNARISSCGCIQYDGETFRNSTSIVMYLPGGRLGNMISSYLMMLWVKLEHGYIAYLDADTSAVMKRYFENIDMPVLEKSLCDYKAFPWETYGGDVRQLKSHEWSKGRAIKLTTRREDFMRHEVQGNRQYYKKYRKQSLQALTLRSKFRTHASDVLRKVERDFRLKKNNIVEGPDVTFVGVHDRRTDYLEFRRKRLKLRDLYHGYFEDAFEYFRSEYGSVIFVFVSDDMAWGKKNLSGKNNDLYFEGCGDGDNENCVGEDLARRNCHSPLMLMCSWALLAACNHTILTHGTFGHWASYLNGGEFYSEYGAIVPDPYT